MPAAGRKPDQPDLFAVSRDKTTVACGNNPDDGDRRSDGKNHDRHVADFPAAGEDRHQFPAQLGSAVPAAADRAQATRTRLLPTGTFLLRPPRTRILDGPTALRRET
jgi:hypothetical protein